MRMQSRRLRAILAAMVIGLAALPAVAQEDVWGAGRWRWLADTYWYVPQENLPALASGPTATTPAPVSDQTVYHIVQYANGYFWGPTAVSYMPRRDGTSSGSPSCLQLVGSITPEGRLHLTFSAPPISTNANTGSRREPTVGIGTMVREHGEWLMENQMSTLSAGNVLLTHWAHMRECRPGDPCFSSLPGVGLSVPQMLAPCAHEAGGSK